MVIMFSLAEEINCKSLITNISLTHNTVLLILFFVRSNILSKKLYDYHTAIKDRKKARHG